VAGLCHDPLESLNVPPNPLPELKGKAGEAVEGGRNRVGHHCL